MNMADPDPAMVKLAEALGEVLAHPAPQPAASAAAPPATSAPTPEIPAAPLVPAPVAAAHAAGPQPPPGKAPLAIADLATITRDEAVARMDEVEWLERQEQGR
jgi:hypothetical protein